jgi:site-specific recombinase XerD
MAQSGRSERWWLEGTIGEERVRRSFKSRDKAVEAKLDLELKHAKDQSAVQMRPTWLSEEQLREAEALFQRLPENGTLTQVYEFWERRFDPTAEQKSLKEAIEEYKGTRSANDYSAEHVRVSHSVLDRFVEENEDATLATVSAEDIEGFLMGCEIQKKTWDNYRSAIGAFLRWCHQGKGWLRENPVHRVRHYGKKHYGMGIPEILSPGQAAKLMAHVDEFQGGKFAPWFALALFAGIRPSYRDGELRKLHDAGWQHFVNLEAGIITITREIAKTSRHRKITIQSNLRKWLEKYPPKSAALLDGSEWKYNEIRRRFGLGYDVLRHSFISYLVGRDRSVGNAALQAGNSESMIHDHYLDLVTEEQAAKFWAIEPT